MKQTEEGPVQYVTLKDRKLSMEEFD